MEVRARQTRAGRIAIAIVDSPGAPNNFGRRKLAGAYVVSDCGASVPGARRDQMAFTSACLRLPVILRQRGYF
jgi:hypothetical protein